MRRSPLVLFAVAVLGFGTAFAGIKVGLGSLPPLQFAGFRFDVGAVVLLSVLFARRGRPRPSVGPAAVAAVAVGGVFLLGLNGAFLFVGQRPVTSGAAAVTYSLAPVVAPLLAVVLLGERLDPVAVIGTLLALVGVGLVAGADPAALATLEVGQLYVAGAAVSVAVGSVLLRRVEHGLSNLALTAWSMAVAAVGLHAASLLAGEPLPTAPTATTLAAVLWVGLPATALAFPAYFGLIARVGPSRANLVAFVVPVVATVTGVVVLGETVRPGVVAGFLLIAAGFGLVERRELRRLATRLRSTAPARTPPATDGGEPEADDATGVGDPDEDDTERVPEPTPRG